ncbi:MAG TPA: hypothetical protein DD412_02830 [Holosporales bacterium]|nr:hypothetical protein [Holosporales bacterium]
MTQLITAPPTIVQGPEHPGSKKMPAKADHKLDLAETLVDKTIFTEQSQGSPMRNPDLPSSRLHQSPDGRTVLVSLNETGVETRNKLPLDQSTKMQKGVEVSTRQTVKNPYIKTA